MSIEDVASGRDFIFVNQYEWRKGTGQTVLGTGAIGACTGIATFSKDTKTGHLLHEPLVQSTGDLDNFFKSVVEDALDPEKIKVWVRGGSYNFETGIADYNDHVDIARKMVEEKIQALGLARRQVDIRWAEYDETIDMSIDCQNGRFYEEIWYSTSCGDFET